MKKFIFATLALICTAASAHAQSVTPAEARAIAKDAVIYGFPLVDNYRIQYSYFVDRSSPEFKAPWNQIVNNARVYTPDDKAIQTPNSDTPYSYVGVDLRAESRRAATTRFSSSTNTRSISPMSAAAPPATAPEATCWPGRAGTAPRRKASSP
jgi:hypothetical protein